MPDPAGAPVQPCAVIVPARNAERTLEACLGSIDSQMERPLRRIVVDDGSSDGTASIARRLGWEVVSRQGPATGPMEARYAGVLAATECPVLVFVDADVILPPGGLALLCAPVLDGRADAVTGLLEGGHRTGTWWGDFKNEYMEHVFRSRPEEVDFLYGSAFAVRASELDVFEPIRGPFGSLVADSELGLRLAARGRKVRLEHRLLLKHLKPYGPLGLLRNDYVIPFLFARMCLRYRARGAARGAFSHASVLQLAATLSVPAAVWGALWGPGPALAWLVFAVTMLTVCWGAFLARLTTRRGAGFAVSAAFWLVPDACAMTLGMFSGALWEIVWRIGGGRPGNAA
ncbi:MAG: hypothetical protein MOGMAGMI_01538 [Candidatus Omnitrophica bacterium]|nr:hypothetical protein [Candidatus Omnitrophota bacterium]